MHEDDQGVPVERFRHWEMERSILYDTDGNTLRITEYKYGRIPIKRLFDGRSYRGRNIGASEYYSIAERQIDVYNRSSELILSDVYQAFPILQGPEQFVQGDKAISVGPSNVLPMKAFADGAGYGEWKAVDFPKGSAESIRQNIADAIDQADRDAGLTKPAGAVAGTTTAQSGISKDFDFQEGNALLSERAQTLVEAERQIIALAMAVHDNGRPTPEMLARVRVTYPLEFDLYSAEDLSALIQELQAILVGVAELPTLSYELLTRLVRLMLPGLTEAQQIAIDGEIEAWLQARASQTAEAAEALEGVDELAGGKAGEGDAGGGPGQDATEDVLGEQGAIFGPTKTEAGIAY
jgi:hypothetical protein